ncbi:MAG: family peptidase [Ignavibacteria bacterium]|nr:family peptidase [Ignavibacteria bacterium]
MNTNKLELMSPAGSSEALMAAIKAGADSVYFGLDSLNMRNAKGSNFTMDDLPEISGICRSNNIKSYLTLNTVIYDNDIDLVRKILDASLENKISAVIATDHAVMNYAKKIGQNIHISTQCNISNIEAVEFYSAYANVMVMARELTLTQVAEIAKQIEERNITGPNGELVRLEVFGHGALCMSISGKCYLSLDNYGNSASANRGSCAQNCRRNYIVIDKISGIELEIENEYIMSAKDLCTINFLDKIKAAGVSVLKIEGRGRSADYVYTVTKCYREAIDSLYSGDYSPGKFEDWLARLSTVFNRGFWDGYYLGKKLGEWSDVYSSKATKKKIYVGKGVNYFPQAKVAEFVIEDIEVINGDDILIIGPTTGVIEVKLKDIRANGEISDKAIKGDLLTFKLDEKMRESDKLYKLVDSKEEEFGGIIPLIV